RGLDVRCLGLAECRARTAGEQHDADQTAGEPGQREHPGETARHARTSGRNVTGGMRTMIPRQPPGGEREPVSDASQKRPDEVTWTLLRSVANHTCNPPREPYT